MKRFLQSLNRLRPLFSRKDKIQYIKLLFMMLIGALFEVLGIGIIPAFVGTLAIPDKIMSLPFLAGTLNYLNINTSRDLILWGSGLLLVVFVLKNSYLGLMYYKLFLIVEEHRVRLADQLFSAYIRAPYPFHLQRNSAELLRNVSMETLEIIRGVIIPALSVILGFTITLMTIILLVVTTPPMVMGALLLVVIGSVVFFRLVKKRLKLYGLTAKEERKETIRHINQGLGALVDARVTGRESYLIKAFHRSVSNFARVNRLRQVIARSAPFFLETVAVIGLLTIVVAMVVSGKDILTLIPTLALFAAAIARMRQSIGKIIGGMSQIQFSIAAIPNVTDDLQLLGALRAADPKRLMEEQVHEAVPFREALTMEGVTYYYPESDTPALHDINLAIRRGESVAFVGPTGSGKSTLVNLLLGLLEPQEGTIRVDGNNIFENIRGWLSNVGYIPQTIFLMDDTIRRNIAFSLEEDAISDDKVWSAAQAAQLDDFIRSLPKQLDTMVGERGVRLSGGQRQRIGLARAIYDSPNVLVMDEATSALDNQTENQVMEALVQLKGHRTLLMIAHRLSTVKNCDRLYFLKDGRIKAAGTYEQLIHTHQEFKEMAEAM